MLVHDGSDIIKEPYMHTRLRFLLAALMIANGLSLLCDLDSDFPSLRATALSVLSAAERSHDSGTRALEHQTGSGDTGGCGNHAQFVIGALSSVTSGPQFAGITSVLATAQETLGAVVSIAARPLSQVGASKPIPNANPISLRI